MGQVYVLFSRVTDPQHLELVGQAYRINGMSTEVASSEQGLPPDDLLEDVCRAWREQGLDVTECLRQATSVTNEWVYTPCAHGDVRSRISRRAEKDTTVPIQLKNLDEIINAQPRALVAWLCQMKSLALMRAKCLGC